MQVGEQVGADYCGDEHIAAFGCEAFAALGSRGRGCEARGVEERGTVCTSDGMVAFSIVLDTTLVHLCTLIGI